MHSLSLFGGYPVWSFWVPLFCISPPEYILLLVVGVWATRLSGKKGDFSSLFVGEAIDKSRVQRLAETAAGVG